MQAFTVLKAVAAPLLRDNVNTDVIIRIERLFGRLSKKELGRFCFEAWRYDQDGVEDPQFVLNQPPYRLASILLAGHNFACGSSREGAVNALMATGIQCVIAPSFGDIFFNNCFQNGLLPVVLPAAQIAELVKQVEAAPTERLIEVDLHRQLVVAPDGTLYPFTIPALRRDAMLKGLEEVGQTLLREASIRDFQQRDRLRRPWIYELGDNHGTNTGETQA